MIVAAAAAAGRMIGALVRGMVAALSVAAAAALIVPVGCAWTGRPSSRSTIEVTAPLAGGPSEHVTWPMWRGLGDAYPPCPGAACGRCDAEGDGGVLRASPPDESGAAPASSATTATIRRRVLRADFDR